MCRREGILFWRSSPVIGFPFLPFVRDGVTLNELFTFPLVFIFRWTISLLILLITFSYEIPDSFGIFVYQVVVARMPCCSIADNLDNWLLGGYQNQEKDRLLPEPNPPQTFSSAFPQGVLRLLQTGKVYTLAKATVYLIITSNKSMGCQNHALFGGNLGLLGYWSSYEDCTKKNNLPSWFRTVGPLYYVEFSSRLFCWHQQCLQIDTFKYVVK